MAVKKLKLFEIVNPDGAGAIGNLKQCKNLKGSTTLKIRRALKPFVEEIKDYEELRNEKINELGVDDPSNPSKKMIHQSSPNFNKFVEEITEVLNSEVEITVKDPIDISVFETEAELSLSDTDFDILVHLGIITDGAEEEEVKAPAKTEEVKEEVITDVEAVE